jgi:hypothetical protein
VSTIDVEGANQEAFGRIINGEPWVIDIDIARRVIPGLKNKMLLHAGPPIQWNRMAGPMKGAAIGALIFEGWADDEADALKLLEEGEIDFSPNHDHDAVGPMAGITAPSMPVFIIENQRYGNRTFCTLNEGLGKVLRYGAYSNEVIDRLNWMKQVLAPALKEAIKLSGGINLKEIISRALHMGDECHNRNFAGTSLFLNEITPYLLDLDLSSKELSSIINFIKNNGHFFLNLSMPAIKSMLDPAHNIKNSTIVTVMSRNGVDFGIRVSGLGDEWFTDAAPIPKGLYFPGYSEADANPDIGDSSITETGGIGGFAMASAPAIVQFVGGTAQDAVNYTKEMYNITWGKHKAFTIPYLNFVGTPTGIDIIKVVETGITPVINTGIAHKEPGVGQVGAGILRAPISVFNKALRRFAEKIGI